MSNRKHLFSVAVLCIALTLTQPAFAEEILGKVAQIEGQRVKVEYQSDYAPREGDPVQIGFEMGGEFIPARGDWKIVEVTREFVWAEAENADAGTLAVGYTVKITSTDPRKRSEILSEGGRLAYEAHQYTLDDQMDIPRAIELFQQAAEKGFTYAHYAIGSIYEEGLHRGVRDPFGLERSDEEKEADYREALKWFRQGADQGGYQSQKRMGHYFFMGKGGLAPDPEAGEEWYRKAESNSPLYASSSVLSPLILDLMGGAMTHGFMTPAEVEEKRVELYLEWARKGDKTAQRELRTRGLSW